MALQKQLVGIDFGMGIDTKTSPNMVITSKLAALTNGQFIADKEISKRYGCTAFDDGTTGLLASTEGFAKLASFAESPLGLTYGGPALWDSRYKLFYGKSISGTPSSRYEYRSNTNQSGNHLSRCAITVDRFGLNTSTLLLFDSASLTVNGRNLTLMLLGWGSITYYSVVDSDTGEVVVAPTSTAFGTSGVTVRALASGTRFLWCGMDPGGPFFRVYSLDPSTWSTASFITVPQSDCWDWADFNGTVVWAGVNLVSDLTVKSFSSSLGGVTTVTKVINHVQRNSLCVARPAPGATTAYIFWQENTNGLQGISALVSNLNTVAGPAVVSGAVLTTQSVMSAIDLGSDGAYIAVLYQSSAAPKTTSCRIVPTSLGAGSVGSIQLGLLSCPLKIDGQYLVWLTHSSTLQSSYFLCSIDGFFSNVPQVVGRSLYGSGYGYLPNNCALNFHTISGSTKGHVLVPESRFSASYFEAARITTETGSKQIGNSVEFGGSIYFSGGLLWQYDGINIVEHNFLLYPEGVTAAQGVGGSLADGTYQLCYVYEWIDAKGKLHQSAPSPVKTVTIAAGGGVASIDTTFPNLPVSYKQGAQAVPYMTDVNGSVLFRNLAFGLAPTLGTSGTQSKKLTAVVTTSDILYTAGNVYKNIAVDGPDCIGLSPTRVSWSSQVDPDAFGYGQVLESSAGLRLASELVQYVPPGVGRQRAHVWMDDKCIVFRHRGISWINGDGPNSSGQQNTFSNFQVLSTDLGIESAVAWAMTPRGIIFKDPEKGIYLIGRDLSCGPDNYIGQDVEAYNGSAVLRCVHVSSLNQVRFLLDSPDAGKVLAYDYRKGQWAVWSGIDATDLMIVDPTDNSGQEVFSSSSFALAGDAAATKVLEETPGAYSNGFASTPANHPIGYTIETGWLAPSGSQGWNRIYRALFLGVNESTHTLQIDIGYDYESSFNESHTISSVNATKGSSQWQVEVSPLRQKCQAIRFRLSDTGSTGESFRLNTMTLEIGVKYGAAPFRAEKGT